MSRCQLLIVALNLLCATAMLLHTLLAAGGFEQRERVRTDLQAVEADIAADARRASDLRTAIAALKSRPDVQERFVRDELGYVRQGDLLLDLGAVGARAATP